MRVDPGSRGLPACPRRLMAARNCNGWHKSVAGLAADIELPFRGS